MLFNPQLRDDPARALAVPPVLVPDARWNGFGLGVGVVVVAVDIGVCRRGCGRRGGLVPRRRGLGRFRDGA
ncbi:unnamed protein product, partial [Pelagomonas calceolata]